MRFQNAKAPEKLPLYIKEEEFYKMLKLVKKRHHKLAFILAFNSGLRISEIINLKKQDFDLKGKKIFIREGKGGKDRVVPLPKGFPTYYLDEIPLKCGVRALQIAFKHYIKRAGIDQEGLHFHNLRHSFAVRCLDRGMPTNYLQTLLGHANLSTTSIYTKANPKDALNSYEKIW